MAVGENIESKKILGQNIKAHYQQAQNTQMCQLSKNKEKKKKNWKKDGDYEKTMEKIWGNRIDKTGNFSKSR